MPLKLAEFLFPAAVEVKTSTYYFSLTNLTVSDRRLLCLKCSLLRENYTYTLSKRKSQVSDESLY